MSLRFGKEFQGGDGRYSGHCKHACLGRSWKHCESWATSGLGLTV